MKKLGLSLALAPTATAMSLALAVTANAQGRLMEEIVVTAQKREQSLQDVGISVTAFGSNQLEAFDFQDSTDVVTQVPNFEFGTPVGEGNNPAFVMRGVGLVNPFEDNQEGKVGIYRDGVYQGTLVGQTLQMFDLERVEVLRGPQGTLYGRNSTGGLVNFIARKPDDEFGGYIEGTAGQFGMVRLKSALNIPVSDKIKTRFAIDVNQDDGYVENRTLGIDGNDTGTFAGRGLIDIDLGATTVLLNLHGARVDNLAAYYQHQGVLTANGGLCTSEQIQDIGTCTDFFGFRDDDDDPFAGEYDRSGGLRVQNLGGSITLESNLGQGFSLTSITAVETYDKLHEEDTDLSPVALLEPTFTVDTEQVTQEIRIEQDSDNYTLTAGLYGFWDKRTTPQLDLVLATDEEAQALLGAPFELPFRGEWIQETRSGAAFVHGEYDLTPDVTFVGGLRYTIENKDFTYNIFENIAGSGVTGQTTDDDETFAAISARAGFNYTPTDNQLYYFSFSRGFQSGGFNGGFDFAGAGLGGFDEEILHSFEVGAKTNWFEGRLQLNASAFYYDYNDVQLLDFDPQALANVAINADQVDIFGGEIELVAEPVDGLTANLALGLLDSEIKSGEGEIIISGPVQAGAPTGTDVDIDGNELVLAPTVSANGVIRYEEQLGGDLGSLAGQVEFTYKSEHFFSLTNDEILGQDGYSVWNTRLAWTSPDGSLEVAAFADNVFNKRYRVWSFDFSPDFGFIQQFFGRPRTVGGQIGYRF